MNAGFENDAPRPQRRITMPNGFRVKKKRGYSAAIDGMPWECGPFPKVIEPLPGEPTSDDFRFIYRHLYLGKPIA